MKNQTGINCKKCTSMLVQKAEQKSLFFKSIHRSSKVIIKSWLFYFYKRIRPEVESYKTLNCHNCLRPSKNLLKKHSALFRVINSWIDPYFDQYLARLVTEEDMKKAQRAVKRD